VSFNRKAFPITETDLNLIANAAIIGDSRIPKTGNKSPALLRIAIVGECKKQILFDVFHESIT
jgi:hypothetical protein